MTDADGTDLTGGCFCGHVRYRIAGGLQAVFDSGYCHCSICRRLHAAPVMTWANIFPAAFRFTSGFPKAIRSSDGGQRLFCPECGTHLAFMPDDSVGFVSLTTATLDDPEKVPPRLHMCFDDRLGWFEAVDGLPTYPGNALPHPDRR